MTAAFWVCLAVLVAALAVGVTCARKVNIAVPTGIGALMLIGCGFVSLPRLAELWHMTWDATFTLVGLVLIAHLLDAAGFFGYWALRIAAATGGRGLWAWLGLMALTTAVTAFLANDGAVLIMTPIVAELVLGLGWPRATAVAFLFAQGFLVDATSTLLTTSNLTNILTADAFDLSFLAYLQLNWLGWVAIVLGSFVTLGLYFRRALGFRFDAASLPAPETKIIEPGVFRAGGWILGALALAYMANSYFRLPTSVWVGAGAVATAIVARTHGALSAKALLKVPPWHIVIFAQAMFVMVDGVSTHGLTRLLLGFWQSLGPTPLAQALGVGLTETVLSSAANNLPALLVALFAFQHGAGPLVHLQLAAALVGANLGSKLTPIGSLATLMWIHLLEQRGFRVSWGDYMRFALVVTLPVVLFALLVLAWQLAPQAG